MVFSDILSETAQFYLYQVYVRTTWPSVRMVFVKIISAFERNSEIFWNTGHRLDVLPCCPNGLLRLPKQCRLLKSNSLLNTDWPSVRTVLLWRPDVFIVICWTLRGFRTPSKARPDGCTGTDCFELEIAWNLHGHFLRNLWPYTWHEMRHCPYYLKTLNRTDNPVKKQPLHKVFLSIRMLPI
jgi:hypothetical protein